MASKWKKVVFSETVEILGGGTPRTTNPDYWDGEIPWLSVVDFNNDLKRVWETEKSITKAGLENSSTRLLQPKDIIISARGTVGAFAQIALPMAFNQSCYGLRAIPEVADADYIYYALGLEVENLKKISHGAVFDTITRDTFTKIETPLPPLPIQRQIAAILSAFDDKIELNHQMNRTLEQMARAIFKSWFVDFDPVRAKMRGEQPEGMDAATAALFPSELVEVDGREVPKGWEWRAVGDIADIIDCLHSKNPRGLRKDIPIFS